MDQDRRRATRHFFSAQAEILEPSTTLRVSSRVGELRASTAVTST